MKRLAFLVGVCGVATLGAQAPKVASQDTGQTEFQALKAEYDQAYAAYLTKYRAAAKERVSRRELRKIMREHNPIPKFLERFQAGAAKHAGKDTAVPYLTWVLQFAGRDAELRNKTFATLVDNHAKSAKFGEVAEQLWMMSRGLGKKKVNDALETVLAENEHPLVKGAALFSKAQMVLRMQRNAGAEAKKAAIADLRQAIELAPKAGFAKKAQGVLFEQDNLQVGMKAPDISGNDIDGVAFKLSDYKGKVIMLDFWGDW